MALLASLIEGHATPALLTETQAFFRDDAPNRVVVAELRSMLAGAAREDRNQFEACLPLFQLRERKDRLAMVTVLNRVDLNRPSELRQLNRIIRVVGALKVSTATHKMLEILEFARAERVPFLEETSVVTLCQLQSRKVLEQSPQYFHDPGRSLQSLNGYVRGARYLEPARIMIGPLAHLLLQPKLDAGTRALAVESLERMDLSDDHEEPAAAAEGVRLEATDEAVRLQDRGRPGEGRPTRGSPTSPSTSRARARRFARRAAVRVLRGLCAREAGVSTDTLTERLYRLLEDADQSVRQESLLTLLTINDDYAAQVVTDEVREGRTDVVARAAGRTPPHLSRPGPLSLTPEAFNLVKSLLTVESAPVQEAIRSLAADLCQGAFAEETRQVAREEPPCRPWATAARRSRRARLAPLTRRAESIFSKAKLRVQVPARVRPGTHGALHRHRGVHAEDLEMKPKEIDGPHQGVRGERRADHLQQPRQGGEEDGRRDPRGVQATRERRVAATAMQQKIQQYSSMRTRAGEVPGPDRAEHGRGDLEGQRHLRQHGERRLPDADHGRRGRHPASPRTPGSRCANTCAAPGSGPSNAKGIGDVIAYQPEEILVDLRQVRDPRTAATEAPIQAGSLERLRKSMFVPEFRVPAGKADRPGVDLLPSSSARSPARSGTSSPTPRSTIFKKYLQERWNDLMRRL